MKSCLISSSCRACALRLNLKLARKCNIQLDEFIVKMSSLSSTSLSRENDCFSGGSVQNENQSEGFVTSDEEERSGGEVEDCQAKRSLRHKGGKVRYRAGRKSNRPDEITDDLLDTISGDEYLCKKILFTNKNLKNTGILQKVLNELRRRCSERDVACDFSVKQIRNKFKSIVASCKKASLTKQTASGIEDFIEKQG